ncbi:MAG TPA: helix-turn-helix domain-containing protein [Candidatus Faecivicinus avistercoris]|nr:helix-turn-helix domain-containing protein [Candidatus Faecivicinus avistercoris]
MQSRPVGQTTPRLSTLNAICDALDCQPGGVLL